MKHLNAANRTLVAGVALVLASWIADGQAAGQGPSGDAFLSTSGRALLDRYCVGCHNQYQPTAGLALDGAADLASNPAAWEKVVRKLRAGLMPPAGQPRPQHEVAQDFAASLEVELDRLSQTAVNPGRPALHRLNRTEYQNAVRDLLELEIDAASLLPPDDSSHGFDNVAASLGVSPALLERYVSAAVTVSRLAVGNPAIPPSHDVYRTAGDLSQTTHIDGLPLGTRGGLRVRHHFPLDGEYAIKANMLLAPAQTRMGAATGGEQLEIILDGERVGLFNVDDEDDLAGMEVRVQVPAGPHWVGAAFLSRNFKSDDAIRPLLKSTFDPTICIQAGWTCLTHLGTIGIAGPLTVTGSGETPSRKKVFACRPQTAAEELSCVRQIVSTLGNQAYRRPVTDEDLEALLEFYERGRAGGSFETGIETALQRILASPEFVFRFIAEPGDVPPGGTYYISDIELASRLSFFLWSTIPDGELLDLAAAGRLRQPGVLEGQVRRMLAHSRSDAMIQNFAGQWLYLRNLDTTSPVPADFPDFDDNLRQAFKRETGLFFESIVREDRNVLELLTADYTFVNERLARHYGIPNVYGSHFRRLRLGPAYDGRHGLLGKGSVLFVTSYPNRTSPVVRGKWILEQILGSPPPAPPPDVPELAEQTREEVERGQADSVRTRLEAHRANAACASCHNIMDPIGLSLENFDAIGAWRTTDESGAVIDASSELVDGTRVDGPSSLRAALLRYSDQFVRTFTENLMVYGLGRGVEYFDMPVVRSITREAARDDYRFSAIVMGIVNSAPFQMKIKETGD